MKRSILRACVCLFLFLPAWAAAQTARYAYAIEANIGEKSPAIVGYSVNPTTGYLRPLESMPVSSDNYGVVVDPSNKFLYIPTGPQILGYHINVNGSLQALKGSPFSLYGGNNLAFTPNGKFAYSTLGAEFSMNSTTGALTQVGTANTGGIPIAVAVNPAGTFVYIVNYGDSTISAYSVDQTSGVLTEIAGSPFTSGVDHPGWGTVSPDGKFLFAPSVTIGSSATIGVFAINGATGSITAVAGSPFPNSAGGGAVTVSSTSQFPYVAGQKLGAYSINSTTGAITAIGGSPYALPSGGNSIVLDPTGKFLYVPLFVGATVVPGMLTFSVNSTTGALTKIADHGSPDLQVEALAFATGTKAVTYTPKFAYASNQGANSISEWTLKDSTGALTPAAGSPIADANGPRLVAATPSGTFVYSANANNSVSEYSVNATTGALTEDRFAYHRLRQCERLGRRLDQHLPICLDSTKDLLDSYSINAKTGTLTAFSSEAGPANPQAFALDPTGAMAAVTTSTLVQTYTISDGAIAPLSMTGASKSPLGATAFDQSSQYVVAAEPAINSVAIFRAWGNTNSPLFTVATGNAPSAILAEPSGKYLYVANSGDGTISAYTLNNLTGKLTQIGIGNRRRRRCQLVTNFERWQVPLRDRRLCRISFYFQN